MYDFSIKTAVPCSFANKEPHFVEISGYQCRNPKEEAWKTGENTFLTIKHLGHTCDAGATLFPGTCAWYVGYIKALVANTGGFEEGEYPSSVNFRSIHNHTYKTSLPYVPAALSSILKEIRDTASSVRNDRVLANPESPQHDLSRWGKTLWAVPALNNHLQRLLKAKGFDTQALDMRLSLNSFGHYQIKRGSGILAYMYEDRTGFDLSPGAVDWITPDDRCMLCGGEQFKRPAKHITGAAHKDAETKLATYLCRALSPTGIKLFNNPRTKSPFVKKA